MEKVKISSWIDAKNISEKEIEKRLDGEIENSWVDSIWLTPYNEGNKWIVKLKVVMSRRLVGRKGYDVFLKLDSLTGEIEEFQATSNRVVSENDRTQ